MTTGHVFIATSLDGFIARPDGALDWLSGAGQGDALPEAEDFGYAAFMAAMDGIVMGRATFDTVAGFDRWPYEDLVVVLSDTLRQGDIPGRLRGKVRLMSGPPERIMATLDDEGWRRAYIDGGHTIRRFLQAGCIDEMILSRLPVLIGRGRPLFGAAEPDLWLTHLDTRSFPGGMVQSRYRLD